ncbi:hypothetical protein K491DRAFT_177370 [Lophiostoma macrostomum CBS 122681]|uniref:Aminoglycoside phosphotransferase domain-containing protein n=1 Tax=Lophiostoma macrostomum CBS 122681 TaxID=1314788 RepID=A0A6A6TRH3_9PLEO|nr:hypothetical protein K491DRAFT_177370 [Lophiostoma macrostomum CBS 122681]
MYDMIFLSTAVTDALRQFMNPVAAIWGKWEGSKATPSTPDATHCCRDDSPPNHIVRMTTTTIGFAPRLPNDRFNIKHVWTCDLDDIECRDEEVDGNPMEEEATSFDSEHDSSSVSSDDDSDPSTVLTEVDENDEGDGAPAKEEEDDDDEPANLRADWEPILALPQKRFNELLASHLTLDHCAQHLDNSQSQDTQDYPADVDLDFECVGEFKGGFNHVRLISTSTGTYAIKVPCTGTPSRWHEFDAYMLRSEAQTMQYIRTHASMPAPEVIAWSDTLDNPLGAPYIIMKAVAGVPAMDIWYDRDENGEYDLENADKPSTECMAKRETMLRSLADTMARLGRLRFERTGVLDFEQGPDEPEPAPVYTWATKDVLEGLTEEELGTDKAFVCQPSFSVSHKFWRAALDDVLPRIQREDENEDDHTREKSLRVFMEMLLACEPFTPSSTTTTSDENKHPESFILRHDDLNLQNIFVDPSTGHVTSILDWDDVRAVPVCLGYTSLPDFLKADWCPNFSSYRDIHMPWELERYRAIYSDAMREATRAEGLDVDEAKCTPKSAIYDAVMCALMPAMAHHGADVLGVARKLLREIRGTRGMEFWDAVEHLGEGWDQGREYMQNEMRRVLRPADGGL